MPDLTNLFPELTDPVWIKKREASWEFALEHSNLKSEYRLRDLNRLKRYFISGEIDPGMPHKESYGWLYELFPIQSAEGYDYLYSVNDYTSEQVKRLALGALLDLKFNGLSDEDQLVHWDYHLGKEFTRSVTRQCKNGPVTIELDPFHISVNYLSTVSMYLRKTRFSEVNKFTERLGYLFSALQIVEDQYERDRKELERHLYMFTRMHKLDFPAAEDSDSYRYVFVEDFKNRMESTNGLPKVLVDLWNRAKEELKS